MNFHKHQKDIRQLLHNGWRKNSKGKNTSTYNAGCYIISQKQDDITFKMGLSTGTYKRLSQQYKICFPFKDNYFLRYLIISKEESKIVDELEKKLAVQLKQNATKNDRLELLNKQAYSKEWFLISRDARVNSAVIKVLKANRHLWTHYIRFTKTGWKVIENTPDGDVSFKHVTESKDKKIINGVVKKPKKQQAIHPDILKALPFRDAIKVFLDDENNKTDPLYKTYEQAYQSIKDL